MVYALLAWLYVYTHTDDAFSTHFKNTEVTRVDMVPAIMKLQY